MRLPERIGEIARRISELAESGRDTAEIAALAAWIAERVTDLEVGERASTPVGAPAERTFAAGPPGEGAEQLLTDPYTDESPVGTAPGERRHRERYIPMAEIGRGGMARVVEVYDRELRRRVAMKLLPARSSQGSIEQFLQEAQVTAQLEHPAIVPVHDVGVRVSNAGVQELYYTMKLVQGRPLSELVDELHRDRDRSAGERLREHRRLLRALAAVCQAVDHGHSRGVVHRDLKPANVMVGRFGEVYVLDWGIASVVRIGEELRTVLTEIGVSTRMAELSGTPGFMAPEVLLGAMATPRSDVYALGAVLYVLLTGRPPFQGHDVASTLQASAVEPLVPPRTARPDLDVPEALDQLCSHALERDPEQRLASAGAFHDALETWLDGVQEAERRRAESLVHLDRALERSTEYLGHGRERRSLDARVAAWSSRVGPGAPLEEKRALWRLEDRAHEARFHALSAFAEAERAYDRTLEFDPTSSTARRGLADLYYDRFVAAELEGADADELHYFKRLVEEVDDGRYTRDLKGDGVLRVTTEPPGAEVFLSRYVEVDRQLVPCVWRPGADPGGSADGEGIGRSPTVLFDVPMGSYRLVLRHPGFRDLVAPIRVARGALCEVHLRLRTSEEIGAAFVYVPGGPVTLGGDPQAPGGRARRRVEVGDVYLSRFPVTAGEYLEFLQALGRTDPRAARRRAPRWEDTGGHHWIQDLSGRWRFPVGPDPQGIVWAVDLPIVDVTWHDAVAYCAWRSERDGRPYRLPREDEWEKAARGADERRWPWGDRFDASWCNMGASRPDGRMRLGPVGELADDVSPYGVRDLAGNVNEWCEDLYHPGMPWRTVRGGAWQEEAQLCRSARRLGCPPNGPRVGTGFRLACEPSPEP